jgi:hypothetical protein
MKNLVEFINENIDNESNRVNESLGSLSLLAASVFFTAITMAASAAAATNAHYLSSHVEPRSVWQIIKDDIAGFFKDKKLKKIAEKYKNDEEIQEYVKNPNKKGWRKMLETKLEPEEVQYINSLTRTYFK